MKTQTNFRGYSPDQLLLLPPDLNDWLPSGHIVYFIRDIVGQLDLEAIYKSYDGSKGGHRNLSMKMRHLRKEFSVAIDHYFLVTVY